MNDCFESVRSIQRYYRESCWNFSDGLFSCIQACMFSRLKLLLNFYVKRTVRRQDFGAKFNLTYHNGAGVADILKATKFSNRYSIYILPYSDVDYATIPIKVIDSYVVHMLLAHDLSQSWDLLSFIIQIKNLFNANSIIFKWSHYRSSLGSITCFSNSKIEPLLSHSSNKNAALYMPER